LLGNTETTGSSKGSGHAQAQVHSQQQQEIIKSDMVYLTNLLNDPVLTNYLKSLGLPVKNGGMFQFDKEVDIAYMKEKYQIDKALVEMGLQVSEDYFYDTYAIPKPKPSDTMVNQVDMDDEETEPADENSQKPNPRKPVKKPAKPQPKTPVNDMTLRQWLRMGITNFFGEARS
jgi:phage gp29-like protein